MAESSTNLHHTHSNLSNEHLLFAETLRDWRDPLLHGHEPLPILLCPRCATCKCESLKDLRNTPSHSPLHHAHTHDASCPNFRARTPRQHANTKPQRRAISHDPSISSSSSSSSSLIISKSANHSPLTKSTSTILPIQLNQTLPHTDDLYEADSLNSDGYETPTTMSEKEDQALDSMDEEISVKKRKLFKRSSSDKQGRGHSIPKATSNDLSSSASSSSSLSIVPLRKKSQSYRISSPVQVPSSLSDDSLSRKHQARSRSVYLPTEYSSSPAAVYLLRKPNQIIPRKSFGLTKSDVFTWKNDEDDCDFYPRYSIEQVLPNLDVPRRSISTSSRNITLQRGQTDYWENSVVSPDAIITSSCENSTGSASHLLSSPPNRKPLKTRRNSQGHIISITTTKRQQPSLLNKSKTTQWNVEGNGRQLQYHRIKWHSDDQSVSKRLADTKSSNEEKNLPIPVTNTTEEIHEVLNDVPMDMDSKSLEATAPEFPQRLIGIHSKQSSYASTDEDVDELNSRYSDILDRPNSAGQASREKSNPHLSDERNEDNRNTIFRSRIWSTEYSQITLDSGVDINSEQKLYQPNQTLTINEHSSEERTDQNDLFALSDDSLVDVQSTLPRDQIDLSNHTEQEIYFSAKSELNTEKDPYVGFELEAVTDEDEDQPINDQTVELIDTCEASLSPPPSSSILPQFEFKLPSFGEWIDRVFTTFLAENNQNQPPSISSSRSSSIVSIHGSQSTTNTSSSSQVITIIENQNFPNPSESARKEEQDDDEHSLDDMSSSSLNCDEKVDFDTYIINSNYEKINPSITTEENEILFINERSKSSLSSITSAIASNDQEVMNPEQIDFQYPSNSHDSLLQSEPDHFNRTTGSSIDDLTRTNPLLSSTFHSKDSALGLSDDHLNQTPSITEEIFEDKIDSSEIQMNTDAYIDDDTPQQRNTMNESQLDEHDQSVGRTISSSSSEQLIPKEKQTGMYYPAFGSSAAIHLAEQYRYEWLPEVTGEKVTESDDHHLRIVHPSQTLGDNEDEFYFAPQTLHPSSSCPNLSSNPNESVLHPYSYSLTTLDTYKHLHITHQTLEEMWLSLLDLAYSDQDDYELGEYRLRHIRGLSNPYSTSYDILIEKSRSHNDVFALMQKNNPKSITKNKSKSFDITSLIKHSSSITNDSANIGLLQGADISEPFADRLISTSMHSDLDSIPSLEPDQTRNGTPSPPPVHKEPLDYVFNFFSETNNEDFDFDADERSLSLPIAFDTEDIPLPILPIQDTYTELSLFRPHSLSTIPSSRASQYASSIDSDDMFEREQQLNKENSEGYYQCHVSDDDHGVIGSDFSSPRSRPLSSIQSRPFSPEQSAGRLVKFAEIDHEAWERAIDEHNDEEEMILNDEYSNHLTASVPVQSNNSNDTYLIDQIEPILFDQKKPSEIFIEQIDTTHEPSAIKQDDLIKEPHSETFLDPAELSHRLEQLDFSIKTSIIEPKRIPEHANQLLRYPAQRIDKVSDLEIVKQGNGFKIGYADRQGTEQRIILTKRIRADADIMERDPQIRLPCKGRRILNQTFSSVLYTNGYNTLQEDQKFQHSADEMEVPIIGTNPKHFDESDMISIDIDGPSTMLNSICESLVITQGSVYSKPAIDQPVPTSEITKKEKIQVIDSWHDRTVINGNGTPWRSPFKPPKSSQTNKQEISTRDIALSPIPSVSEHCSQTISTSPLTVDRSCQYSPPSEHDQGVQYYFDNVTTYELPGYLKSSTDASSIRTMLTLERSADSGILLNDHQRMKSNLALQVDMKSLSSDSEDTSDVTTQAINIYEHQNSSMSTSEIEQEIDQLRRERTHVLDLLSLNWNRSNIWVELTEAKLNYIIGETDVLLRSLSFDPSPVDNETIKLKMHQYEEDMAELTRQHLAVYRERLEDSKRQLDQKIDQLEWKKSSLENQNFNRRSSVEQIPRLLNNKRSKSFLSTSADNLTVAPFDETIVSHPHLLDISFLSTKPIDQRVNSQETVYRPLPRYSTKNLSTMEGLSQSQQAIIDETDELVKDSQQLHTESASQFERARESLLSSETSIRIARANLAASRSSERRSYLPKDVTLAELFKYEQSLAKEAAKNRRHIYSTDEF